LPSSVGELYGKSLLKSSVRESDWRLRLEIH